VLFWFSFMVDPRKAQRAEVPGLAARRVAADIVEGVLRRHRTLDAQLDGEHVHPGLPALADRDRALVRMLVTTVVRRLGTLRHLLESFLDRGFPADAPRVEAILLVGAAQILLLDVPDHAAVDLAVRLTQADRRAARYPGLVNAVLRRLTRDGAAKLAELDPTLDTPDWLLTRWTHTFGSDVARAIATAQSHEPPLDLTVKAEPERWAAKLRGHVLSTGSIRTTAQGPVSRMPGYDEGVWWVQDAAAALPARLLGDVNGLTVADICAAPGGKTAQLALAGAKVTAVDRSRNRIARLRENMHRLGLRAETVIADVAEWEAGPFDAVLLDAPCSSTGTIRRHPDVRWLKTEADIATLADLQRRLLDHAVALVRPGGLLVYCSCSLQPEEGEQQIDMLLARTANLRRVPLSPADVGGLPDVITPAGDLRTLPCHLPDPDPLMSGLDGFYAARLQRL